MPTGWCCHQSAITILDRDNLYLTYEREIGVGVEFPSWRFSKRRTALSLILHKNTKDRGVHDPPGAVVYPGIKLRPMLAITYDIRASLSNPKPGGGKGGEDVSPHKSENLK